MSDDLVKQADAFRLGSGPTDEQVDQANLLIDRMSSRIEELEAKVAEAVRHMSDEELLHREYEKLLRERIEELEADLRKMSLDYLAVSGQAQESFQMYVDANEARIDAEAKLEKAVQMLKAAGVTPIILAELKGETDE